MRITKAALAAALILCLASGAFALGVLEGPIDSALSSILSPVAKTLGINSDSVKKLENGDSWTNILYAEDGTPAVCDVFTVTNNKASTPESVEVTRIIRKQARLDKDGKPGEYRSFDIWFLQKNDGTVYIYGDNIGSKEPDPTCGMLTDKTPLKNIYWYQKPLMFLPGKLKKGRKWDFLSPAGVRYGCQVEKMVKLYTVDNIKLETWLVKYTASADGRETVSYRWFAPQISFYLRYADTADTDGKARSTIADLLIPMK